MATINANNAALDALLMKLWFVKGQYPLAVVIHPHDVFSLEASMPDQQLDLGIYVPGAYVPVILHDSTQRSTTFIVWNTEQYDNWLKETGIAEDEQN